MLEEQRGFARLELADILTAGVNDGLCVHKSRWTSKHAYAYMKKLEGESLWPAHLARTSVPKALESANRMPDPVPKEFFNPPCTYTYKHETPAYRKIRSLKLDTLNKSIRLCLHCVRSGSIYSSCSQHSHS